MTFDGDEPLSTGPDADLLLGFAGHTMAYGAADTMVHPFTCPLLSERRLPTGREVLRSLAASRFCSAYITDIDQVSIPGPGYHPGNADDPAADNDEVHTDHRQQHVFLSADDNDGVPDAAHLHLKTSVVDEHVYYVLLHEKPALMDEFWFSEWVVLFAVGVSATTSNLVGVIGYQVCHNLCD